MKNGKRQPPINGLALTQKELALMGGLEVDKSVIGWGAEDGSRFSCADDCAGVDEFVAIDPAVVPGWTKTMLFSVSGSENS